MPKRTLIGGLPQQVRDDQPLEAMPALPPIEAAVFAFIHANPGKSRHDISHALNWPLRVIDDAIRELEKLELIERREDWA